MTPQEPAPDRTCHASHPYSPSRKKKEPPIDFLLKTPRRSKMENHLTEILSRVSRLYKAPLKLSPEERNQLERTCIHCSKGGCIKHGTRPRNTPRSGQEEPKGKEAIQRILCKPCKKTFSRLPPSFLPRFSVTLQTILRIAAGLFSWKSLLTGWNLWRSTIQRWKKIGQALLSSLPELLKAPALTCNSLQKRIATLVLQDKP